MSFSNPVKLNGLSTRDAITDAAYRLFTAFDENSAELLQSALTSKAVLNINGKEVSGYENVKRHSLGTVGVMDTTHFVMNPRVDVADDKSTTARLTVTTLAQHYPTGMGVTDNERRLLGGSKHAFDMMKDEKDGLWKIDRWAMKTVWREGDTSVIQPPSAD